MQLTSFRCPARDVFQPKLIIMIIANTYKELTGYQTLFLLYLNLPDPYNNFQLGAMS